MAIIFSTAAPLRSKWQPVNTDILDTKAGSRWEKIFDMGFPGGAVVKNPPANAGDTGSSPGPGRSHVPRSN